jgi:Amt family ammonium transporter
VCIGAIAGIVVPLGINFLEHMRIDDPIGAVPVHAFCGIWGTLSLGFFATGQFGIPTPDGTDTSVTVKGLFYGGGINQLTAQAIGSISCILIVSSVALIIMFSIRQIRGSWNLRLDKDGELEGLDIVEHGTPAYHVEFGYGMSYTTPAGGSPFGGAPSINLKAESENQPV